MSQQRKPEYLGDPTLARVMRRPQWILALALALLVAAVFAWLGQWQMSNAIRTDAEQVVDTEIVRPLAEASTTGKGVPELGGGAIVEARGAFVAGDSTILSPRQNGGVAGAWIVGHFVTEAPEAEAGSHLAVGIGWAPDEAAAQRVLNELEADPAFTESRLLEGRYMPPEGPKIPDHDADPQQLQSMMPARLADVWSYVDAPVYAGFLVMHDGPGAAPLLDGLDPIDSVAPLPPETVNWLNVFYAIEWVVFAGFAVFFWFRLTRDAWEKEHELQLLEAGESAAGENPTA